MKKIIFHPITLLLLLIVIFFNTQLFFGEVFYCCDNLSINIPSKTFLIEELRNGKFPLVNPYILSGTPFLADINLGILYPLNLLYVVLSPFRALTIGIIIDFIIAAIGMYVFARSVRISEFGALITSLIFTFSGTLVTYTNNVPLLQVASLLPWVMWAWGRSFFILAILLSMQIFAGHPQITYYSFILGTAYFLFLSKLPWQRKTGYLCIVGGLTLLLSSVQLIPFIKFVLHSTRLGRGFAYASFDSLHPLNIGRLFIPNMAGNLSQGMDWIQGGSIYGYIGILPFLLLFFLPRKSIRHARFFAAIAGISFILAFGKYTPVFFLFYKIVPGIGLFRSPQHFLLLYTFAMATLAGYCIDNVYVIGNTRWLFRFIRVVGIFFICFGIAWIFVGQLFLAHITKFSTFGSDVQMVISQLISFNMMVSGTLLLGAGLLCSFFKKNISLQRTTILFAMFFELLLFSKNGLVTVNEKQVASWFVQGSELAKRMQEAQYGKYRIFVSPKLYINPVKKQFGVRYTEKESAWQISILRTNINMLYHLSTIDGYASLIDRSYKEQFQKEEGDPTGIDFGDMKMIDWDAFGVRYIIASPNEEVFNNNKKFIPIWSDERRILYENSGEPNSLEGKK